MDPIREEIIRLVDKYSFTVQNVMQTFGFLPDGRELVEVSHTEAGQTITFPDRSDEGWAGFSLTIPGEASFSHAAIGFLSRSAIWFVRSPPRQVVRYLSEHNEEFPPPKRKSPRTGSFTLDHDVKVKVGGSNKELCIVIVTQKRSPDAIADAIKARGSSFRERWSGERPGQPKGP